MTDISSLGGLSDLLTSVRDLRNARGSAPTQETPEKEDPTSNSIRDVIELSENPLAASPASVPSQSELRSLEFSVEASRTSFQASGPGFRAEGFSEQLSLNATFQQGDFLVQLNVEIQRSVLGVAYGSGANQESGGGLLDELLAGLPEDVRGQFEQFLGDGEPSDLLSEFFSPENTANRITDFALGGFGFFEGGTAASENSEESRQRFADYILPAIEEGFQSALGILGELPEETTNELGQTRSLIDERFADFVTGLDSAA
ncbi:hypothetical protein Pan216_35230 [Planctomycetes bacterium Pan216]|uniref:DUF5610 domain-containing protein n=1 Tax=Kolteria novifilia TaxID=2527975 RepID=A0A518B6R5_9BACT|nr:hypothetical protein Pan216_35230 [Planctomycetes bacterium Pan216]